MDRPPFTTSYPFESQASLGLNDYTVESQNFTHYTNNVFAFPSTTLTPSQYNPFFQLHGERRYQVQRSPQVIYEPAVHNQRNLVSSLSAQGLDYSQINLLLSAQDFDYNSLNLVSSSNYNNFNDTLGYVEHEKMSQLNVVGDVGKEAHQIPTQNISSLQNSTPVLFNGGRVLDTQQQTTNCVVVGEEEFATLPAAAAKRHKSESEQTCCNCKMSNCLKRRCKCFLSGLFCSGSCRCQSCSNKPSNRKIVEEKRKKILSMDPKAFTPKIERNATTSSAKHRSGCNCRKGCSKKYCECFKGEVSCSENCNCRGCKNTYGEKDGIDEEKRTPVTETEFDRPFVKSSSSSSSSGLQMIPENGPLDVLEFNISNHVIIKSTSPNSKRISSHEGRSVMTRKRLFM